VNCVTGSDSLQACPHPDPTIAIPSYHQGILNIVKPTVTSDTGSYSSLPHTFDKQRTIAAMKFFLGTLFMALLVAFALAAAPQKPIVVSYSKDTPDSVLEEAKAAILKAVRSPASYREFLTL